MKLATVNPELNVDIDQILSKDVRWDQLCEHELVENYFLQVTKMIYNLQLLYIYLASSSTK